MSNALIAQLDTLLNEAQQLNNRLRTIDGELAFIRASLRQQVAFSKSKNADSYEFHKGNRVVKAKANRYGRYKVWEGKRIIDNDCMLSLQEIRLNIALGRI